mmetsp:Transcript_28615/g.48328  ORF Transcript_28615/g.48328 Transcript_28615/m.48328 type:complete len:131 (+) Transcript_28615:42-434(+)
MWKANLQRSIREIRFVTKQTPECHGLYHFIQNKLPELRTLNPNTFFSVMDIAGERSTQSNVNFVFGDSLDTIHEVEAAGVSSEQWVNILKEKIDFGLTLEGPQVDNHMDRETPVDVVHAYKYNKHLDDHF